MKRVLYTLVVAMMSTMLLSCSEVKGYQSPSENESSEAEIEEIEEKPQRTEGFYERLLENFCQRYYKDCFNIDYKENSLRINQFSVVNSETYITEAYIQGVHSYSGWSSHKDVKFTAVVKEKEENYFEVFFCKEVEYLFDDENGKEAATRNMSYTE